MTAPLRASEPITVPVALGDRAYDIVIGRGLLSSLGARIAKLRPGARTAIVTDETVASHHLSAAEAALASAGVQSSRIVVPAGEASKSFARFEHVCEEIITAKIERGDLAIALGGGVIGDLAGLPRHQLAILPGTTHVTVADRVDLLVPMIKAFLDAPMPEAK